MSQQKTKVPVLAIRMSDFIAQIKEIADPIDSDAWGRAMARLWDDEVRFHFDNGRAENTLVVYIARYRTAIKDALGDDHRALAYCNTKKLRERLEAYAKGVEYNTAGVAHSVEGKIENAEENTVGRKATLQMRISDFIAAMNGVTDLADMRRIWKGELTAMSGKAQTTVISYITKYRNAIREAFGDNHPMLKIAAGDPAMYDDVRRKKAASIADQHAQLITFTNYREVIAQCAECLKSDDPLVIGIGLLGVTGRRPYEVFTQAEFTPASFGKGVSKWSLNFKGQAKTKEREGTKFGVTYEIPTLAPAAAVLDAYNRLRNSGAGKLWLGMTSDEFTADARITLRDTFTRLFQKLWPADENPTPYGLRHLYAEVAYRNFAPKSVSKNSYFAAVLGHNNNDLETSLSYMSYSLPDDDQAQGRADRMVSRTSARLESL